MSIDLPRRELNRVHTWSAIHEAAYSLVLSNGLATATVDAISDQADVSRRTFFNYFATKEDAVLGLRAPRLSDESLEAFDASDDQFARAVYLMAAAVRSALNLSTSAERRELLKLYPELRARLDLQMRDAEALVRDAFEARSATSEESSRALVMLAGTVMRFAFTPRPDGTVDDSSEALDAAITQFREVLKEAL